MNIYKLLLGIILVICIAVGGPYAASHAGYMPKLSETAWLILVVSSVGLCVKCLVGDVVAGEFLFHKFGYDNCIMTFGSVLTAAALQLMSKSDLFPGVDSIAILRDLPHFSSDPVAHRTIQLFVLLLIALLATLLTASISASIKQNKAKAPHFLALVNSVTGTALLAAYVLVLVTKG